MRSTWLWGENVIMFKKIGTNEKRFITACLEGLYLMPLEHFLIVHLD